MGGILPVCGRGRRGRDEGEFLISVRSEICLGGLSSQSDASKLSVMDRRDAASTKKPRFWLGRGSSVGFRTDRRLEDFSSCSKASTREIMRLMSVAHQRALRGQRGGGGDDSDDAVQFVARCRIAVLVCRGRSVVEGMVLEPLASLDTSCLRFDDVAKTEEPPFVL